MIRIWHIGYLCEWLSPDTNIYVVDIGQGQGHFKVKVIVHGHTRSNWSTNQIQSLKYQRKRQSTIWPHPATPKRIGGSGNHFTLHPSGPIPITMCGYKEFHPAVSERIKGLTDTWTHRHTDTQTHGHTDTRTHRHTDTRSWSLSLAPHILRMAQGN